MVDFVKLGVLGGMVACALSAAPAHSVVIGFDDLGLPHGTFPNAPVGFDTNGFHFSNNADIQDISATSVYAGTGPAVSGDFAALNDYGGKLSVTRIGGGTFNLASFYIEGWFGNYGAQTATGYLNGVAVASIDYMIGSGYNVDTGWRQIMTGFIGVDEVEFTSAGWGVLIDNVDANIPVEVQVRGVPEPASWGLMMFGFAVVGWSLRQRKGARVRFA